MVNEAKDNGMSVKELENIRSWLTKHKVSFGLKLGSNTQEKV